MTAQSNEEKFLEMLKIADPELYQLKVALAISHVNPMILMPIIKTLGSVMLGSGHGKIEIYMSAKVIKNVIGQEQIKVEQSAESET